MKQLSRIIAGLLASCLSVSGLCGAVGLHAAAAIEPTDEETLREYREIVVNQVNNVRAAHNLPEVAILPIVNDFAQIRAEELTVKTSHTRPDGRKCFTVIKDADFFYNDAAENLNAGYPTPLASFNAYMASEDHRNNILRSDFTHIGIGYCYDPEGTFQYYWSMFLLKEYGFENDVKVFDDQYIPERELGDANGSHRIDAGDASDILDYAAASSAGLPYGIPEAFRKAADLNTDGEVNAVDASILLAYCAAAGADPEAKLADYIW